MKKLISLAAGLVLLLAGPALAAGGVFRIGTDAATNLDPGFVTNPSDILIVSQVYERLVDINPAFNATPGLATSWNSTDSKTWTFKLRPEAKFSDGKPVTAKDVIWTFNRLRDPKIGTPTVPLYANIKEIKAEGDHTVVFILKDTNPEFPLDSGDYHACIIPDGITAPAEKNIGSGAYLVKNFLPEDRAILAKNPHFKLNGPDGSPLPKFDEIHFIFSPDIPGQIEALRGGELDFVGMIPIELTEELKTNPATQLILGDETEQMVIHMRSDGDRPGKDMRVRQALKLGTNHDEIIAAVRPGLASPGNNTPVTPAYRDYYLDKKSVFDPVKAKALLKEAGYEKGLNIRYMVPNYGQNTQIATVWAQQMAAIGVKAEINMVPSDVYYSDAPDNWLECDFGMSHWSARATPVTFYNLAYITGAVWNSAHWSDPEFDETVKKINTELDKAKRVEFYKKSQEIFIERAPAIVVYVSKDVAAASRKVKNLTLGYSWVFTRFWEAGF